MKYFTPELLAHSRSLNDDAAEVADDKWERRIIAYKVHLKEIRRHLPLGARQLLKHVSLHDAQLLTINRGRNRTGSELCLTFRLAGSASKSAGGVELRYSLTGQSRLVVLHEPQALPNGPVTRWVLYDEFDLAQKGRVTAFTHSLLMTGGLEFRIKFFNLRLRRFGRVLLADSNPAEIEKELADDDQLATA
ncbi:MAG TPA: hypothetical protein VG013_35160 [Gemmataceae bacterium]|jgi:hypothetical protein|nr:hypothetical protein [Gemmataceae bacterium]